MVRSVVEAAAGRVPVTVGVSSRLRAAVAGVRRRRQGRGRAVRDVAAAARLPRRRRTRSSPSTPSSPPAGCRSWPTTTPRPRASTCPPTLIARIYEEVDGVVAIKECSGDTRRIPALLHLDGDLEVVVGGDDWALEGFAAGAIGWITGVGVLAPRETVELYEAVPANDLAARARRVPSAAPRRPLRHDLQARPVLQGRPGRRRLQRRPDPRAAPAAEGRRGRGARGGARDPARAGGRRECEPPATSRRSTPTRRGCRRASSPAASARSRAPRCWSASSTSRPQMDDLRLLLMREPRGHGAMSGAILQPPARPDADWGVLYIEVSGLPADVRARHDRRRDRAGRDRHGRGHRARDRDPARRPRRAWSRRASQVRERPRAVGHDPQRRRRSCTRRDRVVAVPGLGEVTLRHGLRRQLLRDHAGGRRGPGRRPGALAASWSRRAWR